MEDTRGVSWEGWKSGEPDKEGCGRIYSSTSPSLLCFPPTPLPNIIPINSQKELVITRSRGWLITRSYDCFIVQPFRLITDHIYPGKRLLTLAINNVHIKDNLVSWYFLWVLCHVLRVYFKISSSRCGQ